MGTWTKRVQQGILMAGFAGTVLAVSGIAGAAPKWLRLSYTDDTSSTMSITWNTDASEGTEVRYGITPGDLNLSTTGTSFEANGTLGFVHEVTLTGLAPRTEYFYIAGSDADGFSAEQSFNTGPVQSENCGSFKFVFLGDNRPDKTFGGGENWPQILGQASLHQPDFVVNGGDLVISGSDIGQWKDFLGWTASVSATTPFMPAIGNHDNGPGEGDTANYNQLFALPRSTGPHGSGTEDYYYFTYGNAIFVTLSTEGFKDGTPPFSVQAAWMDEVLTNNPRKWKFVYYHKPTYTHEAFFSISHEPNEVGQNEAFVTVIDKHHVDVVFTSHNHWYERFHPSACAKQGKPGSSRACSVGADNFSEGTVYYVSGGAGAFTIPGFLCGSETGRAACSGDHHYLLIDVQDEVVKIDTWGAFPQTNKIIDSITITKPADVCVDPPDAGPDAAIDAAIDAGNNGGQLDGGLEAATDVAAEAPATPGPDAGSEGAEPFEAGSPGPSASDASSDGGCGCRVTGGGVSKTPLLAFFAMALGLRWRQRRR